MTHHMGGMEVAPMHEGVRADAGGVRTKWERRRRKSVYEAAAGKG
jgi:hypothetical protein